MSEHGFRVDPILSLAMMRFGFLLMVALVKSRPDLAGDALNLCLLLQAAFTLFIGSGTNPGRLGRMADTTRVLFKGKDVTAKGDLELLWKSRSRF
jgi:hypothetical protein